MNKFLNKIKQLEEKKDASPQPKKFKFPLLRIIFDPFTLMMDHFGKFIILLSVYAIALTAVSMSMGFSLLCLIGKISPENFFCVDMGGRYLFHLLVRYIVVISFMVSYYNLISDKSKTLVAVLRIDDRILGSLAFFTLFLFINLLPMFSFYLMYVRDPNPNWRIELVVFACLFSAFVIPFVAIRLYSLLGFYIEEGKVNKVKAVWNLTKGNMFRLLVSLSAIVLVTALLMLNYVVASSYHEITNVLWGAFSSEFFYNVIMLISVSFFTGYIYTQKRYISQELEANEQED